MNGVFITNFIHLPYQFPISTSYCIDCTRWENFQYWIIRVALFHTVVSYSRNYFVTFSLGAILCNDGHLYHNRWVISLRFSYNQTSLLYQL